MQRDRESRLPQLLLQREVEEFLYHEADLLDGRRFAEWLDLLSDDLVYFVPISRNVKYGQWDKELTKESSDISWFEEGKSTLELRVRQLATGQHWAEEPISRISHLVTNIRIIDAKPSKDPQEVAVTCRFLIYRNRLEDDTDIFVGKREDVLRREDGQWRICRRKAVLNQSVLLAQTMLSFI